MSTDADVLLLHLRITGVLMAALVAVNLVVPYRFNWRGELATLSLVNRQIFQAHAGFLILTLGLLAALLLTSAPALLEPTRSSRALLVGLTIFWGLRMLMQWCFYSPKLWRGHTFNTVIHFAFSIMWIYVTAVFGMALHKSWS
jgi:hypothetical protein